MNTSFSIPEKDEVDIKFILKVKQYCKLNSINFSAFVVAAIKKHFKDITDGSK